MLVNLDQQIKLTDKLAAAAGNVAEQKRIQLDYDIKQAQLAAGPNAQAPIALALTTEAASKANREAKEGLADMQRQVDLAQQQLDIIRTGAPDMAAQLAMLAKKNDLAEQGSRSLAAGEPGSDHGCRDEGAARRADPVCQGRRRCDEADLANGLRQHPEFCRRYVLRHLQRCGLQRAVRRRCDEEGLPASFRRDRGRGDHPTSNHPAFPVGPGGGIHSRRHRSFGDGRFRRVNDRVATRSSGSGGSGGSVQWRDRRRPQFDLQHR